MDRVLSFISITAKAGKLVSGEFAVQKAIKEGKAMLVIASTDASEVVGFGSSVGAVFPSSPSVRTCLNSQFKRDCLSLSLKGDCGVNSKKVSSRNNSLEKVDSFVNSGTLNEFIYSPVDLILLTI